MTYSTYDMSISNGRFPQKTSKTQNYLFVPLIHLKVGIFEFKPESSTGCSQKIPTVLNFSVCNFNRSVFELVQIQFVTVVLNLQFGRDRKLVQDRS